MNMSQTPITLWSWFGPLLQLWFRQNSCTGWYYDLEWALTQSPGELQLWPIVAVPWLHRAKDLPITWPAFGESPQLATREGGIAHCLLDCKLANKGLEGLAIKDSCTQTNNRSGWNGSSPLTQTGIPLEGSIGKTLSRSKVWELTGHRIFGSGFRGPPRQTRVLRRSLNPLRCSWTPDSHCAGPLALLSCGWWEL